MKKYKGKYLSFVVLFLLIITIGINTYAHSGRTDSSGGHKDNKNKSGLGNYHYHCGGHPAHLHKNGVCPYSSNKTTTSSSTSSSNKTTTTEKTTTVVASSIKINENIETMEIGETKTLTISITPNNTTDKSVKWKSSNDGIITINSDGKITAKKDGNVDITVTTSNGKTCTLKIKVKPKEEKTIPTSSMIASNAIDNDKINNNKLNNNIETSRTNETNPAGTVVALGALGRRRILGI